MREQIFSSLSGPETLRYSILRPSGNDTCLIEGVILDPDLRKRINDEIQKKHDNVEQVGFVSLEPEKYELMMAGGEFCGNATRSAAYLALGGNEGEISIRVSGTTRGLRAGVTKDGEAWSEMPISTDMSSVSRESEDMYVVQMDGITHVVTFREADFVGKSPDELKETAMLMIRDRKLERLPASGVMFVEQRKNRQLAMHPVVYVASIETLFYESACGSGTTAVGMVLAAKTQSSEEVNILQPSAMPIQVCVDVDEDRFASARIQGPIEILDQYFLSFSFALP